MSGTYVSSMMPFDSKFLLADLSVCEWGIKIIHYYCIGINLILQIQQYLLYESEKIGAGCMFRIGMSF